MRFVKENTILSSIYHFVVYYPAPINISYFWNLGFLAGICLVVQLVTGILLAMHYAPNVLLAFDSVEHIMRDVDYGWLLRYMHANGASMFFIVVYLHIFRGLYFGSYIYPRGFLWSSGVVILILMMATGFLGYVLPWGQMSFWAATVITNLFSAFPYVGNEVVLILWGGFSVDNATLNRFFSLHYLLPFVLFGVMILHLVFLHEFGSNNPLGVVAKLDTLPFAPYLTWKEIVSVFVLFSLFLYFVFFLPNYLGHTDNYIPANALVTPAHIVPEWYFLPYYAILRSIPNKLGGVIAMFGSMLSFFFLSCLGRAEIRSGVFRPFYKFFFWIFFIVCLILGWVGGSEVKYPFYDLGQIATALYFLFIFLFVPFCCWVERFFWRFAVSGTGDVIKVEGVLDKLGSEGNFWFFRPVIYDYCADNLRSEWVGANSRVFFHFKN